MASLIPLGSVRASAWCFALEFMNVAGLQLAVLTRGNLKDTR